MMIRLRDATEQRIPAYLGLHETGGHHTPRKAPALELYISTAFSEEPLLDLSYLIATSALEMVETVGKQAKCCMRR